MRRWGAGLGIDVYGAVEAAATRRVGVRPEWPGPGIGRQGVRVGAVYFHWRIK
ncbi:hypothetical protein JDS67_28420 [Bacillus cereus]|uniref:hypothetical protein n=1 Tax=Bacillus cereus TaxID=1396 RepID=UPI0018F58506|nr:hypothetical protein [Bacillus cereus]MBJ8128271.1 hypothetical protein [Bacillus cereus]